MLIQICLFHLFICISIYIRAGDKLLQISYSVHKYTFADRHLFYEFEHYLFSKGTGIGPRILEIGIQVHHNADFKYECAIS